MFRMSPVQRRFLAVVGLLSVGLPLGERVMSTVGSTEPLFQIIERKGPFQATSDGQGGWKLGTQTAKIIAGTGVGWMTDAIITPGTAVDASYRLVCEGLTEAFNDGHILSKENRLPGFRSYGISVPISVRGHCQVLAHLLYYGKKGAPQVWDSTPFDIEVVAP